MSTKTLTLRLANKTWVAVCTPRHRWAAVHWRQTAARGRPGRTRSEYVRENVTVQAQGITSRHSLRLAASGDLGAGPAISEPEAELLGWVLGDGSVARLKSKPGSDPQHWRTGTGRLTSIRLYQCKPGHLAHIDRLVAGLPFNRQERAMAKPGGAPGLPLSTWEFTRTYSMDLIRRSGYDHRDPVPFVLSLSSSQRESFLRGVFGAEGSLAGNGTFKGVSGYPRTKAYAQADGSKQEAIILAIYLSGLRPGITPWGGGKSANLGCASPRLGADIRETKPFIGGERVRRESVGRAPVFTITTGLGTWTMRQGRQVTLTAS